MNILQNTGFWSWLTFWNRPQLDKGGQSLTFSGSSTESGESISAETSLKLSTVWACVGLKSRTIASLSLHLRDSEKKHATDHDLYHILYSTPNADMSAFVFWQAMVASLDLWGNAYALIHRSSSRRVVSLEILYAHSVTTVRTKSGAIEYHYDTGELKKQIYQEDDIFHIKGFSLDGLTGLSTIQYGADTLGGQRAADKAASKEFKNGLKMGGFLKTGEKTLTKEQRERLRDGLAQFSLPENAGKYMVLEAGMDVGGAKNIRMNPADAQLLETRNFGVEQICQMFGVPPQLVGHTDKASSWASSLENTNMGFLTYTLTPILKTIEQEISRKLLSPSDRKKYKAKFNVNSLMRADSSSRASFYTQMLQNGVMTTNEVRQLEDLQPVDGGDTLRVQLNMTTIDKIGKDDEV
ncbi:MAG: phage portal protein [Gammaproteobacteria bacterium]|nr:phage portal protein [Gammaproteobacteria bacterium]